MWGVADDEVTWSDQLLVTNLSSEAHWISYLLLTADHVLSTNQLTYSIPHAGTCTRCPFPPSHPFLPPSSTVPSTHHPPHSSLPSPSSSSSSSTSSLSISLFTSVLADCACLMAAASEASSLAHSLMSVTRCRMTLGGGGGGGGIGTK